MPSCIFFFIIFKNLSSIIKAASEFFGVRIVIVSSIEGTQFITDIQPTILREYKPLLLCHWADFGFGILQPVFLIIIFFFC